MNILNFEDFYTHYLQLIDSVPRPPTRNSRSEGIEWGDSNYSCQNLIYSFDNANCQNGIYLYSSYLAVNCVDCDYAVESELCYQSTDPFKCYNVHFSNYCARLRDSYYCYDCNDSHHLFGCVHLSHKEYCIFNRQYSPEEYQRRVAELLKQPPQEILRKVDELIDRFPLTQTNVTHSENSQYGNHIHYCKNVYFSFDATHDQDCGYLYDSHHNRDCWDLAWVVRSQLCYQCLDSSDLYNCAFVNWSSKCRDSWFLNNCHNLKNCFGCVGLNNKEYCLLNQQLEPEEYQRIVERLKSEFKLSAPQISRW